jgi:hypothetical protein
MQIRRVLALFVALTLATSAAPLLAQRANNQNQNDKSKQPKRSKQEQADIDTLVKLVDAVGAGQQPAPSDVAITWESNHFVKGQGGSTYVPFTLAVSKPTKPAIAMYVRVVDKEQAAAPAAAVAPAPAQGKDSKDKDKDSKQAAAPAPVRYAWDNVHFLDVPADGKLSRAMQLGPGDYDVFIAIKDKSTEEKNAAPAKIGLLRRSLTVPDFNKPELQTSSVILARSVEPQQAAIKPEDQQDNPYVFGPMKIVPAADQKFGKMAELNVIFWIYGAGEAPGGKPDVQVDYNFYQKLPAGEKYFNKTAPQVLNATTLPPEFSVAAGHQLPGSLVVPLASFPAGDYRLEIKITDKSASNKAVTENVSFTVTES